MIVNDCINGQIVEREMTAEEQAQYDVDCALTKAANHTTEDRVSVLETLYLQAEGII